MAKKTNNETKKDGFNMENTTELQINEDLIIKVNPRPTIEEKIAFVRAVVDNSYIDDEVYYTLMDATFSTLFLAMFTNFNFPDEVKDEGKINIQAAYNYVRNLFRFGFKSKFGHDNQIDGLIDELKNDINKQIEFRNQKTVALYARNITLEDTLDNINMLANKGTDFLSAAMDKLSSLTPESIGDAVKNISEEVLESVSGDSSPTPKKKTATKKKLSTPKE